MKSIWVTTIAALLLWTGVSQAADLVYDYNDEGYAPVEAQPAYNNAQPAPRVAVPAPQAVAPLPQVQVIPAVVAPMAVQAAPAPQVAPAAMAVAPEDAQHMPRTELLRRERMREELRNEDALQERLESLRLRDEKSRADKILNADGNPGVAQQGATVAPTALEEQVVTAPVTETPGQPAQAAKKSPAARAAALDEVAATQAADYTMIDESSADDTKISVMPRAGLSNMNSESAYFNVQGRYSAGVGLNVQASSNVAFEVGYTFNEYGVSAASSNPWINNLRGAMSVYGADPSFNETLAMKQNVVDAGMRLYLLNPGAKVRPFVAGGGAYSKSFVNYDSQYLATLSATNPEQTRDYESDGFLGYLGAGLDLMVSKSVSVGVVGKFYQVLTSRQNRDFNNAAFMTYDPRYPNYYGANFGTPDQADKQIYGGSLARANFYTVNAGVNFSF